MNEFTIQVKKKKAVKHSVQYEEAKSMSPFPWTVYIPNNVLEELGNPERLEVVFRNDVQRSKK
jgi:hypothetical protein